MDSGLRVDEPFNSATIDNYEVIAIGHLMS